VTEESKGRKVKTAFPGIFLLSAFTKVPSPPPPSPAEQSGQHSENTFRLW
jgi:hypothetical protein